MQYSLTRNDPIENSSYLLGQSQTIGFRPSPRPALDC